jgi:hypothetical protein
VRRAAFLEEKERRIWKLRDKLQGGGKTSLLPQVLILGVGARHRRR